MLFYFSIPIACLNFYFGLRASKRLIKTRPYSRYPTRIDILFLMIWVNFPASFAAALLDFFTLLNLESIFPCYLLTLCTPMQVNGYFLLLGILIYIFGIFTKKIALDSLEKAGFTIIVLSFFIPFVLNMIRLSTSNLEFYAMKKGAINNCILRNNFQLVLNKWFSYANIACCFVFSIILFVYENYFRDTKNLPKRNNIIISYFLMGLNQLIMTLIGFSLLNLDGTKYQVLRNILTDVPRLRTFFLSLIVIWFEGKGTITIDIYTAKKVLTTSELRNLLEDFIKRTKNKGLKDLISKWDKFQIAKKNNEIRESAIDISDQESKMLKKIEIEGFYLFHFSDEFLSYAWRMQNAGKSEIDIN